MLPFSYYLGCSSFQSLVCSNSQGSLTIVAGLPKNLSMQLTGRKVKFIAEYVATLMTEHMNARLVSTVEVPCSTVSHYMMMDFMKIVSLIMVLMHLIILGSLSSRYCKYLSESIGQPLCTM